MVNVYDYAHNLARALKECPEYHAFQNARTRLKAKPAALEMVKDFQKKRLDLQAIVFQGKEPPKEQKEALERLLGVIQGDADVRDYLMAEERFGVIVNDVSKIISDAIGQEEA
jgi:cell fate (sporulation/competence/biofilm development) regulator YlbF (YheA/YmcA/DUF963 family)